jgi:hypothetical protein
MSETTPTPEPVKAPPRTQEQIKQEIEREREQLALAVTGLRDEVRVELPRVAIAAGIVIGALTVYRIVRRRRHGVVRATFGRYTVIER